MTAAAFAALGFLIGNLTGLSASPIVLTLVPFVFALAGGTVLAFLQKLSASDRVVAGQAILSFSVCCVVGVYVGIIVNEYQLLSPRDGREVSVRRGSDPEKKPTSDGSGEERQVERYLRRHGVPCGALIEQRVAKGLNVVEAYGELQSCLARRP